MTQTQDDLAFAVELAHRAGELLTQGYGNIARIDYKSKRDVVTDVDFRSEALVLEAIRRRHPTDAILAEESGRHAGSAAGEAPQRMWVIDPLDGTVNYANAIPFYCVSIGLVVDGRPSVGVIYDPARDDLLTATADGQACLNGEEIRASEKEALSDWVISLAIVGRGGITAERRVSKSVRIPRRMGSAALSLAYVGSGRFDAFVQNGGLSPWDVAAAALIAERGGAKVTDLQGEEWWTAAQRSKTVSIVAAPEPHHGELLEMLHAAGAKERKRL
ncbi:MAG TPA: inositol monophosphatase family protein [Candidatus Limnocylindria bacterium]|nr:inositol monophosphatase family protein [Candidatus Limnocylindria bacterium]